VPTVATAERAKTVMASAKRALRDILLSCSRSCERRWTVVIGAARLPLLYAGTIHGADWIQSLTRS
jgi:hypothetical protein